MSTFFLFLQQSQSLGNLCIDAEWLRQLVAVLNLWWLLQVFCALLVWKYFNFISNTDTCEFLCCQRLTIYVLILLSFYSIKNRGGELGLSCTVKKTQKYKEYQLLMWHHYWCGFLLFAIYDSLLFLGVLDLVANWIFSCQVFISVGLLHHLRLTLGEAAWLLTDLSSFVSGSLSFDISRFWKGCIMGNLNSSVGCLLNSWII